MEIINKAPKTEMDKTYPSISEAQVLSDIEHLPDVTRDTAESDINIQKFGTKHVPQAETLGLNEESEKAAETDIEQGKRKSNDRRSRLTIASYIDPQLIYGTRHEDHTVRNVMLYTIAGGLFCCVLVFGIIMSSTVISKQITASSTKTTQDLVASLSKAIGRPVDAIGGGEIDEAASKAIDSTPSSTSSDTSTEDDNPSSENLHNCYMKAINQYPNAVKKAMNVSWKEIFAFDSLVKEVVDKTNNPIISEIFSDSVTNPINYIADGYRIWTYIMSVRNARKSPMEPGVALLEAASLVKYSAENKVPLALAVGVTQTESSFNPSAISHKAALGPMQVVYDIHYKLLSTIGITKRDEMFTPDKGIQAGCFVLGRFLQEEKSVVGGLKRYYGVLSPKYVDFVLSHRHTYELYSSGIDKNVALMMNKEDVNWKRMNEIKVPVITSKNVNTGKSRVISNSSASSSYIKSTNGQSSVAQPMTIYKNTGSITIKRTDGSIQQWNN